MGVGGREVKGRGGAGGRRGGGWGGGGGWGWGCFILLTGFGVLGQHTEICLRYLGLNVSLPPLEIL